MTTQTPAPLAYLGTDPETRQLFSDANNFIAIVFNMLSEDQRKALRAVNPHIWTIEQETGQHTDRAVWHFGWVLTLDELAQHPEALQQAVRNFRQRLAEHLPPPLAVLNHLDPQTKHATLELIGRLLDHR